jgi:hypothetical protein
VIALILITFYKGFSTHFYPGSIVFRFQLTLLLQKQRNLILYYDFQLLSTFGRSIIHLWANWRKTSKIPNFRQSIWGLRSFNDHLYDGTPPVRASCSTCNRLCLIKMDNFREQSCAKIDGNNRHSFQNREEKRSGEEEALPRSGLHFCLLNPPLHHHSPCIRERERERERFTLVRLGFENSIHTLVWSSFLLW